MGAHTGTSLGMLDTLGYHTRSVYPISWVFGKLVDVATREALGGSDALVDVLELEVSNTALHTTVLARWTGSRGVHGFHL